MRERFGAMLLAWRTERGHGNPKRFSQQAAMEELRDVLPSISLRTYQSWEGREFFPRRWSDVEAVCEHIGRDPTEIVAPDEDDSGGPNEAEQREETRLDSLEARMETMEALLGGIADQLDAIARRLDVRDVPSGSRG